MDKFEKLMSEKTDSKVFDLKWHSNKEKLFSNLDKDVDYVIEEEKKTHIKVSSTHEIMEKISK